MGFILMQADSFATDPISNGNTRMQKQGTLLLVLGLAGSGKSHLISSLERDFCIEEGFAMDELKNIQKLVSELNKRHYCIVSERKYRNKKERELFIAKVLEATSPSPMLHYICFENDIDIANHNCIHRVNKSDNLGGEQHIAQNRLDTLDYDIPTNAVVLKMHRIEAQISPPPHSPPDNISLRLVGLSPD